MVSKIMKHTEIIGSLNRQLCSSNAYGKRHNFFSTFTNMSLGFVPLLSLTLEERIFLRLSLTNFLACNTGISFLQAPDIYTFHILLKQLKLYGITEVNIKCTRPYILDRVLNYIMLKWILKLKLENIPLWPFRFELILHMHLF